MTFGFVAIIVVILVVFVLVRIQRLKWHIAERAPGARWERTDEVIKDPETGRVLRVWIDPADGSRHYVPERFQFRRRR